MNEPIRVLLADDHPMFVEGVQNALQVYSGLRIVAACTDGEQVLAALSEQAVDVAVLDVNMPGRSGVALARFIQKHYAGVGVVFLTMYHPSELQPGTHPALGYVLKNSGSEILYKAICAAAAGERFMDARLSALAGKEETAQQPVKLSSREKEILRNVVLGKTNKEIADALFVSELTVKTHRKNIYRKLDISNVSTLIMKVQKMGLLSGE